MTDCEHLLAGELLDALWLEVQLLEGLVGQALPLDDARVPEPDSGDWRISRISPFDLGIEVPKDSVDALAVYMPLAPGARARRSRSTPRAQYLAASYAASGPDRWTRPSLPTS
jgi:hypothetical protein